jgi:hypothetical protein
MIKALFDKAWSGDAYVFSGFYKLPEVRFAAADEHGITRRIAQLHHGHEGRSQRFDPGLNMRLHPVPHILFPQSRYERGEK